ncbi:MAG: hypothetical protein IMZ46_14905, partial [Acidobacteria bacterium]|nr:hypothetical protein [Acidobacteriota bacterium]
SLQNLLMLTAARADKGRVMDYIHKIDDFSVPEIAAACVDVGLHEEAFEIFKKTGDMSGAVKVLVDNVVSIDRAQAFAEDVDTPEVWSTVARAQLGGLRVSDALESYIRADDPSNYEEVIETAVHAGKDEELVKFLRMARKTLREPAIDTGLAFCYARLDNLVELEDFLRGTNVANVEESGDKAYGEGLFQAAKIFFTSISNWAKLATTLVHLDDFQAAVECARKANNIKVWKEVHEACVGKKEFRLAQICGLNLIVDAEQLTALVKQYESKGYFDELISLLEQGLGLERAHMGMFTELGIALTKYHPDRVLEHLKLFWSRVNMPKLIRACETANLWPELVFCYYHYDEFDNAAMAVIEHPENSWEHQGFKEMVVKVANLEIYYRAIRFYVEQHPSLLTDLLQSLTTRIDVNRVVKMFQKNDDLPLIKPFLLNVQTQNKRIVNDAINDLLVEEEDYKTLRDSAENYDNYDAVALASRLEKHDLIFFRQIAANIYRKNKRWEKSIALSKQDKLYKDAIETAAISGKAEVVEELLRYVSHQDLPSFFFLFPVANSVPVRRHWPPRVLRRHALRVLRPHPAGHGAGALVAARAERLCDAVHDQHAGAADQGAHDPQARQRGAQRAGEGADQGRERGADPGQLAADDRGGSRVAGDERVRAAGAGLRAAGHRLREPAHGVRVLGAQAWLGLE